MRHKLQSSRGEACTRAGELLYEYKHTCINRDTSPRTLSHRMFRFENTNLLKKIVFVNSEFANVPVRNAGKYA